MTTDEGASLITHYRASVEDEATPVLDQAILAAATRHTRKRRTSRRIAATCVVSAFVLVGGSVAWHPHQSTVVRSTSAATGYGAIEGVTRAYLLQAGTAQFSGPGLNEATQ